MSMRSYYLDALVDLNRPATIRDIHDHAVKLFGKERIRGDRASCRMSLARYVIANKATKSGNLYEATEVALDPVSHLNAKIRILEAERDALKGELFDLRLKLERAS